MYDYLIKVILLGPSGSGKSVSLSIIYEARSVTSAEEGAELPAGTGKPF